MDLDDEVYLYQVVVEDYKLYEAYKISDAGNPIIKQVGYWTKDSNSLNYTEQVKNSRRADLKASVSIVWPF